MLLFALIAADDRIIIGSKILFKFLNKVFQNLLWYSRLVILIAVITGIISTFIMVFIGAADLFFSFQNIFKLFTGSVAFDALNKNIIGHIISSVDAFLIATVLLIFSIGLYELFISKIEQIEDYKNHAGILAVDSLEQLKEKLAKVIIMILIVSFFQKAVNIHYKDAMDLLYLGVGIFLVSLAVYFTHGDNKDKKRKHHHHNHRQQQHKNVNNA